MPNIVVTHLQADEWTPLYAPIPCDRLNIQNADPGSGFMFRSLPVDESSNTEVSIAAGFGLPIEGEGTSIQPDVLLGEVIGGDLIITIGLGLPLPIA